MQITIDTAAVHALLNTGGNELADYAIDLDTYRHLAAASDPDQLDQPNYRAPLLRLADQIVRHTRTYAPHVWSISGAHSLDVSSNCVDNGGDDPYLEFNVGINDTVNITSQVIDDLHEALDGAPLTVAGILTLAADMLNQQINDLADLFLSPA